MTPERRSQIRDQIRVANPNGDCAGWIQVASELLDALDAAQPFAVRSCMSERDKFADAAIELRRQRETELASNPVVRQFAAAYGIKLPPLETLFPDTEAR